ncbi:MAG: hypothetical protein JWN44_5275 [Myxococcales bacterium]|nr:hypothetical protein [Myxococcales bacterium]
MQARRTIEHVAEGGGWSSVAVHLAPATGGKDGFYLTLFPDGRPPTVVFLRPPQLTQLVELAAQAQVSDQQIWDFVAKIPMEPLLPSRSLYPRLRALLVDCASSIRAQIRSQEERPVPHSTPLEDQVAPAANPPAYVGSHGSAGDGGPDDNGSDLP